MTNEQLHALFEYEPDTGLLRRREGTGGLTSYPWRAMGKLKKYLGTTVSGKTYYLHRLVWQYHHGKVPALVDHISNDQRDNRIENLRECTSAQNQYNSTRKANNRSGAKGVVFHPKCVSRPWQAKIVVNKKVVSLGYYETVDAAAAAYARGAREHAKDFARTI